MFLRKVRAKWNEEPTGFFWVEKSRLAASGYPAGRDQLVWLERQGIGSILTLTENPLPSNWVTGTGLRTMHIAMIDHAPPNLEALDSAARYIEGEVGSGRRILVHCLAGKGRTMCAIAAYMMRSEGVEPAEAIRRLRELRPGSVERSQEEPLFRYWNSLQSK